jgi:hypothetical protein
MPFDALLGIVATFAPYLHHIATLVRVVLSLVLPVGRVPTERHFKAQRGPNGWCVEYHAKPVCPRPRSPKRPRRR